MAIQNWGTSGSLFLQSLFDSHPLVLMTPALYSRDFYSFWERYSSKSLDHLIQVFLEEHAYWFSAAGARQKWGLHQMGTSRDEAIWVSVEKFARALKNRLSGIPRPSRKEFFIAVYYAYADALGRNIPDNPVILFPIHSLPKKYATFLVEDFPDTRFLYTVREPIRTIGSAIKHLIHERKPLNPAECAFSQMLLDIMKRDTSYQVYGEIPYDERYRSVSRAVRLEDLHEHPKETLSAICRWMGLPWSETLLESTFDGKKWWNRPESPRVAGFSRIIIQQHASSGRFDAVRLQTLLIGKYRTWNYPYVPSANTELMRLLVLITLPIPLGIELRVIPSRLFFIFRTTRQACDRALYKSFAKIQAAVSSLRMRFAGYGVRLCSASIIVMIAVPVSLFFLIRDYVAIRFILMRAWARLYGKHPREIELLLIDGRY